MINQQRLTRLKQRFGFNQWSDSERPPYGGSPDEIDITRLVSGWHLASSGVDAADGLPRSVRTLWQVEEGDFERVLVLDIYDCESDFSAKEFLLEQLDQFESPLMERLEGTEQMGDVAFSHPGRFVTLFAQGSRVAVIKNAGAEPVPTLEIAHQVATRLGGDKPMR
ncbi:MAG: hypothetical protein GY906_05180 [bacterium]|nr:hypothetical protein [bacterium]